MHFRLCVLPHSSVSYNIKTKNGQKKHTYINREIFENDLSPEIQKKFHAWLLDRNFQEEKEKAMVTLWEEKSAVANESTFQELSRLHKRIEASDRMLHQANWLIYQENCRHTTFAVAWCFRYLLLSDKSKSGCGRSSIERMFRRKWRTETSKTARWDESLVELRFLLVYDKHFRGKRRLLFLNGEARFQVAKDPTKPFLVKTAHMTVKALGTVFNLNAYSDQDVTIATLEEGKIQVYPCLKQDTSLILSPDEQIIYNHRLETLALNTVDAGRVMQWTDGYLIFQTASFDQIVKTIERKFDVTINYETERFAGRSFTMKFNPDEGLKQVLEVMKEMIKGLNYKIKEDKVYIN